MSYGHDISDWQDEIGRWSTSRGWDREPLARVAAKLRVGDESLTADEADAILAKLALVVSEVSEAVEDVRECRMKTRYHPETGKPEGFASELADVVIRVLNLASQLGIAMHGEMRRKMEYNHRRPFKHGGKVA